MRSRTQEPHQGVEEERVSCVYRCMHDRRMYQRGTVAVEIKGGCECEGYGDMPSVWRRVVVARQVGERAEC
eukprot:scaffold258270_cov41-Attheya_sp.AAC.1